MNCQTCTASLPDLLLDPSSAVALAARGHLHSCLVCRTEWLELEQTMASLDQWQAPEPSAWFDTRMQAKLRAEQTMAPESIFERLRSRLLFSSSLQLRPILAGAFAVLLALGGGAAFEVTHLLHPASIEASATVQDLQILDRNDQALQTMDQLLGDDGTVNTQDDGTPATTPTS